MKSLLTIKYRARQAKAAVNSPDATAADQGNKLWGFIDSILTGFNEFRFGGLSTLARAVRAHAGALKWLIPIQIRAIYALAAWIVNDVERKIYNALIVAVNRLRAWTFHQLQAVYYILAVSISTLRTQLTARINQEVQARIRAVRRAEAEARAEIKALHQAIEREAATAYQAERSGHLAAVGLLGDAIAASEPAVRTLVSRIVGLAIDLAEVENPVLRYAAAFLLRHLIKRLGIDRIAGEMLGALALPSARVSKPRGLPEVITLMCARLNSLEQFNAQFMADGGPEILQAGEQWRDETSVGTSVALLAFFGAMVAEPNAWATVLGDTVGAAVSGAITSAADLMGG